MAKSVIIYRHIKIYNPHVFNIIRMINNLGLQL
jgi:hypothetical protein